jgi:ribosomal protein S21
MSVKIHKKPGEDPQKIIKRFKTAVLKSGILLEKRKRLFKPRNISKNLKRESALWRLKKQEEYRRLLKKQK